MSNKINPETVFNSSFAYLEHEAKTIKLVEDVMFRPPTEPDPMELAKAQKEDQALFELEDEEAENERKSREAAHADDLRREREEKARLQKETDEKLAAERKEAETKLENERLERQEADRKAKAEQKRLKDQLAAQVECPECGHKFTPTAPKI